MMPPRGMSILSWTAIIGGVLVAAGAVIKAVVRLAEANPAPVIGLLVIVVVCLVCLALGEVKPIDLG